MILTAVIISIICLGFPRIITELFSLKHIYHASDAPAASVGIVFGAGLNRDGSPTPVLRHRIETAVDLYFQGKIEKLLMSGDNRFEDYNEPAAMYEYAARLGVPPEDIVLDYAGRRTYDTCYRARDIFLVNRALLITQRFHLPRALFICNMLGIESDGVIADQVIYRRRSQIIWNIREVPATAMAFWEVFVTKPEPVLGIQEPIFSNKETKSQN